MAAESNLIALVAAIVGVGVVSQVIADRYRVPSIVFLLAAGVVLGPQGVDLIDPDAFGGALSTIVGLSVGIIVFEGAFNLRVNDLREAPAETLRLVTVGAVIALIGTAIAVRFAIGTPWSVAFLIGALLVATGPTVIAPILEVVPVRDRVGTALETEGIVNDVTAAIVAVVIFDAIQADVQTVPSLLTLFAERLGIGVIVGLVVAAVLWYLLNHVDLSPENAPRNARLLVLAGAVVAYAAADTLATEAGIAAVATAGIVLGNADIAYEEDVEEFKGDVTLIVLSFVFITLAALLDFASLIALGAGGLVVVAAVALVLRPLLVFVSTAGDRFTRAEKLFMSFVGPRGIIPASVATLFAIELRNIGLGAAADALVGTVFLVIFVTVAFEAGLARQIAETLDVIPMRIIVVGGGKVGRALAERLEERGENVVILEADQDVVETARNEGHSVRHTDGTDVEALEAAGIENARIVVAATGDDDANLLVAQLARSNYGVEKVIARVNNRGNVDAFEELGVSAISAPMATAWAIDNAIERPALSGWMTELGRGGDVQEIEVTAENLGGKTIADLDPEIPAGCLIALVSRNGENLVPDGDFELEHGDRITLLGTTEAVREASDRFHPHD